MSRQASGLKAWALQRISAAYIGLFVIYTLGHFITDAPKTVTHMRDWVSGPMTSFAMLLFFALLLIHAWVGIRDVLIDYVKPTIVRIGLLILFGLGFVGCGLWAAKVIFLAALPA